MGEQIRMPYKITRKNMQEAMNKAERLDGRKPFEHRDIEIKFNISINAESSVKIKFGKSEVVSGIKLSVAEPYPDHEKEGTLSTGMDLLPLSSSNFEYGPPTIEAVEIARVVDRGIRESRFIDFEKLCIKEGEKVWCINIDLATINDDGNLIDASSLASVLALLTAKMTVYDEKEDKIKPGEFTDKKLPLKIENMPLTVTFFKIGDKIFVDPTREEEDCADGRITFEISDSGKEPVINAIQKGGNATFTVQEVETMAEEAVKIFKKLNSFVQEEIKKFEKEARKK